MKKIISLLSVIILACTPALAQQSAISKAIKHMGDVSTVKADVKLTRHRAAITTDETLSGTYYIKNSTHSQSMIFPKTKEMLIATPTAYTMVKAGKSRVAKAKGKGMNPFEVIDEVMKALASNANATQSSTAKISTTTKGNLATVTITPKATSQKSQRRMMYSSIELTFDTHAGELRSIRIYERKQDYSHYALSNYKYGESLSDNLFKPTAVK